MRKIIVFILLSIPGFSQSFKAISFNIRYATPNDGINQWENRKDKVADLLSFYEPSVFGLQEALKSQVDYLDNNLDNYAWIGIGRDDGKEKGEFSPIFYNTKELKLLSSGTFWLSETTDKPSKSWDAALPRIATYGVFQNTKRKKIFVLNTHYDHKGAQARVNSSKLILEKIKELAPKGAKVIFMGDFNATPEDEPISLILNEGWQHGHLSDPSVHFGPIGTFTGFQSKERGDDEIDHIFFDSSWKLKNSATLSPTWAGLFPSDHHAIYVELY